MISRELTRRANDAVAAAVSKHPDQFLGFATLPLFDPAAAARELERTVLDLAFVAMRGGAITDANNRSRLYRGIEIGRGSVLPSLPSEQYNKLIAA